MKNILKMLTFVTLAAGTIPPLVADITLGSSDAGFAVSAGTLALGTVTLTDGSIRNTGGTVTGTVTSSNVLLETKSGTTKKQMRTDGAVVIGTSITLDDNEKLIVNGGTVAEDVTINGAVATPSIIEGFGSFASVITVSDQSQLNLDWNGTLAQNISLNATSTSGHTAVVQLQQDVEMQGAFITTSDVGTNKIDFNGYRLSAGGANGASLTIANTQSWNKAHLELSSNAALAASKTVTFLSNGFVEGNGYTFSFGSGAVLANGGHAVSLTNVALAGLTSASLSGSGSWTLANTSLADSSNALLCDGSITSSTVNVFGGATTFGASRITLFKDLSLGGTWTTAGVVTINGRGNVLNLGGSGKKLILGDVLRLEDVTVIGAVAASIDTATGSSRSLDVSNVVWLDNTTTGAVKIIGSTQEAATQGAATVILASSTTAGDLFGSAVSWTTGVHMQLLGDTTIGATWSFDHNSIIEGNGCALDLSSGTLKVATGKTLTLRNVVLTGVVSASLTASGVSGYAGTLDLSNVTVVLGGGDVTWSGTVTVNGPLTVVTGSHSFTGSAMTLNGVTAYYDTLSSTDSNNLVVSTPNTGRVMFVSSAADVTITEFQALGSLGIAANTDLTGNEYLFPTDGGIAGRTISCTADATLNGHARTIFFPHTDVFGSSKVVLSVSDGATLITKETVLNGLVPSQHLNLNSSGTLFFGDGTTMRLTEDVVLTADGLHFGSSSSATGETMTLDLNGHSLDLSLGGINLQGNSGNTSAGTLLIKNGRLINALSDGFNPLSIAQYNTVILQDVEFAMSGDCSFANAALTFVGECVLAGTPGSTFSNTSLANVTISSNSRLVLRDGIIYSHTNSGLTNFVMADASAQLELVGATFCHPDVADETLTLSNGTLIVDHKSYIQPGLSGMTLASTLNIQVRPSATINITTGTGASAGTLTYGS